MQELRIKHFEKEFNKKFCRKHLNSENIFNDKAKK